MEKLNKKAVGSQINSSVQLGKIPPQATDIEKVILGALLLTGKTAILEIATILKPEHFYVDAHQNIYKAIIKLFNERKPVDLLTVKQQLQLDGVLELIGGAYFLTELTERVSSSKNIEHHARIIIQKYILREIIRISNDAIYKAYEDTTDVFELQTSISSELSNVYNSQNGKGFVNASDLLIDCISDLEKNDDISNLTGISSGLELLDEITGGWQKSDFIIVGARPGMGKTAFMLHMVREAAVYQGVHVGIFSLEMKDKQLVQRLISAEANVSMNEIKFRNIDPDKLSRVCSDITGLSNATILIDDTGAINTVDLRAKAVKMKLEFDIKILFIDYLGLMKPAVINRNNNRTNDIGEISRSLKALAKELDIPVIALAQLNRAVEDRPNKKPMLSDLRDSGDIEQDADMVLFLYRPEYYGISSDNNGSTEKKCYLIIAKHRNGDLGTPGVYFDPEYMKFDDKLSSFNAF